jgi:membrane protease YdiL (CAAX protease family)
MSLLPLTDGWTQEMMFRGYVLLRLAKADVPAMAQIAASAIAFASIHIGYIGSPGLGFIWPLFGTATLGAILAWSVVVARGSILPATVAHLVILIVVQPWLGLAT